MNGKMNSLYLAAAVVLAVLLLAPANAQTWPDVFKDAGWLGGKIGKVKISASCAEERLSKEAFPGS